MNLPFPLRRNLPAIVIVLVTLVTYASSLRNGFVEWDDGLLITRNATIQEMTPHTAWRAFTTYDPELYIPLTLVSFQLNHVVGGLDPFGYHLINLLLHAASAVFVLLIATRLTGSRTAGIAAATLFALHPLNVESVAWASARKDVLMAFFALGSLWMWLRWREESSPKFYVGALLFFVLALLSKVSVIVLPVALVLIEWMRGERMDRRMMTAVAPFFAVSVIFGMIALGGKAGTNAVLLQEKMLIGALGVAQTLRRLLAPTDLSVLYPYTKPIGLATPELFGSLLLIAVITLGAVMAARRTRGPIVAWLCFLLFIAPSMANIAKGQDLLRDVYVTSDRYAYLAAIPLFVLSGWMTARLLQRWPRMTMAACCCVIIAMIIGTYRQAQTWHDTETLFRNVLASHPNAHVAHENIGSILYQRGEKVAALQAYQAALEIRPNSAVFFNLGIIALDVGQDAKAEELFRHAIELRPNDAQALTNLGALLLRRGARDEARTVLERAVVLPDAPPEARANLELLHL